MIVVIWQTKDKYKREVAGGTDFRDKRAVNVLCEITASLHTTQDLKTQTQKEDYLNWLYAECQSKDTPWIEAERWVKHVKETHSLSVGDVIQIQNDFYFIEVIGFIKVDNLERI